MGPGYCCGFPNLCFIPGRVRVLTKTLLQAVLTERCRLLERRNDSMRDRLQELEDQVVSAHEKAGEARRESDRLEDLLKDAYRRLRGLPKGSGETSEKEILRLREQVAQLQKDKAFFMKRRGTEERVVDRVCEKQAETVTLLDAERARHADEESRYNELIRSYQHAADRQVAAAKQEVASIRKQLADVQTVVRRLEQELLHAKEEVTLACEQLTEAREREAAMLLEKEAAASQLGQLQSAYQRDLVEAQSATAGMSMLQHTLLEAQGRVRELEAEVQELRSAAGGVKSREGVLVGKILQARSEAAAASAAKLESDRQRQRQHMHVVDQHHHMAEQMASAVKAAAREAVSEAVGQLTGATGPLSSTRALNTAVSQLKAGQSARVQSPPGRAAAASPLRVAASSGVGGAALAEFPSTPVRPSPAEGGGLLSRLRSSQASYGVQPSPSDRPARSPSRGTGRTGGRAARDDESSMITLPPETHVGLLGASLGGNAPMSPEKLLLVQTLGSQRTAARQMLAQQLMREALPSAAKKAAATAAQALDGLTAELMTAEMREPVVATPAPLPSPGFCPSYPATSMRGLPPPSPMRPGTAPAATAASRPPAGAAPVYGRLTGTSALQAATVRGRGV